MEVRERRAFKVQELRITDEGDDGPRITGYAAVFNETADLYWFKERIEPGAFAQTLADGADVRALWNHDSNYVLGRTTSDTLRLREDPRGLAIEIDPPDTQWARDALVTMRRGDVDQMSFGFETVRDDWEYDKEGDATRTLVEVRLFDVSPVTFPAYPQTSAQVRAMGEQHKNALDDQVVADANAERGRARARLDILKRRLELAEAEL